MEIADKLLALKDRIEIRKGLVPLPRLPPATFAVDDRLNDGLAVHNVRSDRHRQGLAHVSDALGDRSSVAHCSRFLYALGVPLPVLAPEHDLVAGRNELATSN